jgi:hypothetical protein
MLALLLIIIMFANSLNQIEKNIHSISIARITVLSLVVTLALNLNTLYFQSIGKGISVFNGLFKITVQSQLIEIVLLLIGIVILSSWSIVGANRPQQIDVSVTASNIIAPAPAVKGTHTEVNTNKSDYEANESSVSEKSSEKSFPLEKADQYSLIAIFSILGGSLLITSADLLSLYLAIELQSFALYILCTLNKESLASTSAGLKYFLLGGLSSCFILLGAGLIYSYTGLTNFEAINSLVSTFNGLNDYISGAATAMDPFYSFGLAILIVGFLFKVSAAPFHQWAPEKSLRKTSIVGCKQSNSGNTLKFIILNYYRKLISGWTNHSEIVTSYKICENKMGNRGTKSLIAFPRPTVTISVKAQRVNGCWFVSNYQNNLKSAGCVRINTNLSCTLMGLEKGYLVKNLSKQNLNGRVHLYSTTAIVIYNQPQLFLNIAPWFITGLSDADGCFTVSISQKKTKKIDKYQ